MNANVVGGSGCVILIRAIVINKSYNVEIMKCVILIAAVKLLLMKSAFKI